MPADVERPARGRDAENRVVFQEPRLETVDAAPDLVHLAHPLEEAEDLCVGGKQMEVRFCVCACCVFVCVYVGSGRFVAAAVATITLRLLLRLSPTWA